MPVLGGQLDTLRKCDSVIRQLRTASIKKTKQNKSQQPRGMENNRECYFLAEKNYHTMSSLKRQLKQKGKIQTYKERKHVMEKKHRISMMECNVVLTKQYTFLSQPI